jgi:hypothetical protein
MIAIYWIVGILLYIFMAGLIGRGSYMLMERKCNESYCDHGPLSCIYGCMWPLAWPLPLGVWVADAFSPQRIEKRRERKLELLDARRAAADAERQKTEKAIEYLEAQGVHARVDGL